MHRNTYLTVLPVRGQYKDGEFAQASAPAKPLRRVRVGRIVDAARLARRDAASLQGVPAMHQRHTLLGTAALALTALLLSTLVQPAEGHVFVFKDGFTVHGRVKQEHMTQSADGFAWQAAVGTPWIEDGVRNIYFAPWQLQEIVEQPVKKTDLKFTHGAPRKGAPLPLRWEIDSVGPWEQWERTVQMSIPGNSKKIEFKQRITQITPETIRIECDRYDW